MGGCVAERRPHDRRKATRIPGSIGELFDASGGLRAATLRAGRFWPPGSSPISSVLPGTVFDRLLPDRPRAAGAAPIQFRNRLLRSSIMKLRRRRFLRLAASALALPAISRL